MSVSRGTEAEMDDSGASFTDLLSEIAQGDQRAIEQLIPLVYEELHSIAEKLISHERSGHTLQPTALVNEAYLRLIGQTKTDWKSKSHFFAIGATMMRRILVDHARGKKRLKRGGDMHRIELTEETCIRNTNHEDVLAVEEALEKLEKIDQRQSKIVELRFYGGLSVEQVSQVLGVSKRTVESDWTMVRAWLRRELAGETR